MERKRSKAAPRDHFERPVREVMDIQDLAAYLGMGKSKIYALIREKKIPASRIGRQYRFSKTVVDQWLREKVIMSPDDSQISLFRSEPQPKATEPQP